MSGFTTTNTSHVIRADLYSADIREAFEDELMGMQYVDWLSDFPDGETWNVPTIGNMQVLDYDEGQAIRYNKMDTGNLTMTITEYKSTATYITDKFRQDSMWAGKIESMFVPKMTRALAVALENDIMNLLPEYQTATNPMLVNGLAHRMTGGGANGMIEIQDFARAKLALRAANVPMTNLIAIVDPSVEYHLSVLTGLSDFTYNPKWEGIVETGLTTGMRFVRNIHGFDIWTSDFLKEVGAETITGYGTAVAADGVANLFFSAGSDTTPFMGAIRQMPKVESERNKDLQRDEFIMTSRYGLQIQRPESGVVIITPKTPSLVYA
jgi:hypothetical protein